MPLTCVFSDLLPREENKYCWLPARCGMSSLPQHLPLVEVLLYVVTRALSTYAPHWGIFYVCYWYVIGCPSCYATESKVHRA